MSGPNSYGAELGACPFCGSTRLGFSVVPNTNGGRRYIMCVECHAHGPWSTLAIDERKGWNDRAPHGPNERLMADEDVMLSQQRRIEELERPSKAWSEMSPLERAAYNQGYETGRTDATHDEGSK